MTDNITIILGGSLPLARALAVHLSTHGTRRLVLADRQDPLPLLLEERKPMLADSTASAPASWRALLDSGRVAGAVIGQEGAAWSLGKLALLRPQTLVVCTTLRPYTGQTESASRFAQLSDDLSSALATVRDYCQIAQMEERALPEVVLAVTGIGSTITADVVVSLVDAILADQIGTPAVEVRTLILPRMLGAGPTLDVDFHRITRALLAGRVVYNDGLPPTLFQFIDQREAASALDALMHSEASSVGRVIPRAGRLPVTVAPGHGCSIAYLATIIADELDQLLVDRAQRRYSLLDPELRRAARSGANQQLADAIRHAVRWYVANAANAGNALKAARIPL